jgi:DNA-binding GntR family transcriptional regulator
MHDPSMAFIGPLDRPTLSDGVYERLGELICSGQLVPGEKLVIDRLAKQFDVSITPVREAMRRLQREGLVTEIPYRGMVVSKATHEQLRELFEVRGLLDGYAAAQASIVMTAEDFESTEKLLQDLEAAARAVDVSEFRRLNALFHSSFVKKARSRTLQEQIADITRNTERYRHSDDVFDRAYVEASQAEHRELFSLLQQRRCDDIERLHRRHAISFVDHLIRGQGGERDADHEG